MAAAGADIEAVDINELHLHRRGHRTTDSSTTSAGTELGVIRIDDLDLKAGKVYWVRTGNLRPDISVTTDRVKANLRYSSAGSATNSSTEIGRWESLATSIDLNSVAPITGMIYPTADEPTASVRLSIVRVSGSGVMFLEADPNHGIQLFVHCLGDDPGDTGIDE
jgi:hypothetical protein